MMTDHTGKVFDLANRALDEQTKRHEAERNAESWRRMLLALQDDVRSIAVEMNEEAEGAQTASEVAEALHAWAERIEMEVDER